MKIGEIKIEAIKLMFANYAFDMSIDDLQRMISDENYGSYIVNMNGSISRALDRIVNACVLTPKSYVIVDKDFIVGVWNKRFDLTKIKDLYLLDRVTGANAYGYEANCPYQTEGDMLVLENGDREYSVIYYPSVKSVDETVSDFDELWIPAHIARLIPLFIKGDLFQEEEPSLAADARNLFEASLEDLKTNRAANQTRIKRVI